MILAIKHFLSLCSDDLKNNWCEPDYMKHLVGATIFGLCGVAFGVAMFVLFP